MGKRLGEMTIYKCGRCGEELGSCISKAEAFCMCGAKRKMKADRIELSPDCYVPKGAKVNE